MRVLMLGWELPPNNSGGLGVACYQLCKALSAQYIDIEFIVPYKAEHNIDFMQVTAAHPQDVEQVIISGIAYDSYKYIYSDGTEEWFNIYDQQAIYEASVARMVDKIEFDVIHAHDWLTFKAALRAKQKTNKPLIAHIHSLESDRAGGSPGNPLVREIEYLTFLTADQLIAVSQITKNKIIEEYNIPEDKIEVVHNSFDHSEMIPSQSENMYTYLSLMKENGYKVVSSNGRLTMQKGLPNFLRAFADVVRIEPKTLLLVVGDGEQYYELIELAAELGIAHHVLFTGFLRGRAWADGFAIADLFVLPSISEPFALTALEAVGYGTPTLISMQSGVGEVLKNSLKVDYWDNNEMVNKIVAAVRSPELRDELLQNAQKEYYGMSWGKSAEKLTRLYEKHVGQLEAVV